MNSNCGNYMVENELENILIAYQVEIRSLIQNEGSAAIELSTHFDAIQFI